MTGRTWTITIPATVWLTANIERNWHQRAQIVRQWRDATVWACKAGKLPTGITPVRLSALVFYVGRAPVRDRLNLAPTLKACVDALCPPKTFKRKGVTYVSPGYGLLPDDSDRHVLSTTWELTPGVQARVELTITAVRP